MPASRSLRSPPSDAVESMAARPEDAAVSGRSAGLRRRDLQLQSYYGQGITVAALEAWYSNVVRPRQGWPGVTLFPCHGESRRRRLAVSDGGDLSLPRVGGPDRCRCASPTSMWIGYWPPPSPIPPRPNSPRRWVRSSTRPPGCCAPRPSPASPRPTSAAGKAITRLRQAQRLGDNRRFGNRDQGQHESFLRASATPWRSSADSRNATSTTAITSMAESKPNPITETSPASSPAGHGDNAFNHVVGRVNCASRIPGMSRRPVWPSDWRLACSLLSLCVSAVVRANATVAYAVSLSALWLNHDAEHTLGLVLRHPERLPSERRDLGADR